MVLSVIALGEIYAAVVAISIMGYNILGFKVLKSGSMAFYTLFLMCGGTIIFSSLAGMTFCEKISKRLILSIIMCFAGTCMFL